MISIAELTSRFPRAGRVAWIGLRPARREPVRIVEEAAALEDGLEGDHAPAGRRAVTLMQAEHLPVIGALLSRPVPPEALRRNLVVTGLNLAAARNRPFAVGGAVLEITGPCPPCSRMEEALGEGGYNAVRGHGGWYAAVLRAGPVRLGDRVAPAQQSSGAPPVGMSQSQGAVG